MQKYYGKYMGYCRDHHDPLQAGRIRAEVPFPLGTGDENWSVWALPCLPSGHFIVPEEGDGVWIEFAGGNVNQPIWVGIWYKGRGTSTSAPWQERHAPMTDMLGNDAETDRAHALDPIDNEEHTESPDLHDHQTTFYTPHRRGWMSGSGHSLEFDDHPGKEARLSLADRFGKLLEMTAHGLTHIVSYLVPAASGLWKDLNGANADGSHRIEMTDYMNDDATNTGQHILIQDMAQSHVRLESTPGNEYIELKDFWGQYIRITAKSGSQEIQLADKFGNIITMTNGKITLFVPTGSHVNVGGESGQELATKTFVQTYFNTHTHVATAPGTPTTPPIIPAPLTPGLDVTNKQLSE